MYGNSKKRKKRRPVIPLVRSREKKYSQKNDDESAEKDQKNHPKLGQKDEEHPEEDDGSKWKNSGWISVDRITKDTLSTYNTWISKSTSKMLLRRFGCSPKVCNNASRGKEPWDHHLGRQYKRWWWWNNQNLVILVGGWTNPFEKY